MRRAYTQTALGTSYGVVQSSLPSTRYTSENECEPSPRPTAERWLFCRAPGGPGRVVLAS